MATITIPEKLIRGKNLILVPRKEYEGLLRMASKKGYTDLDKELDRAIAEYQAGKFSGPFDNVKSLMKSLRSKK